MIIDVSRVWNVNAGSENNVASAAIAVKINTGIKIGYREFVF